jgi:uncharacterized membrane protein
MTGAFVLGAPLFALVSFIGVRTESWIGRATPFLVGFDGFALCYLLLLRAIMAGTDSSRMPKTAKREDEGGRVLLLLSVVAAIAGLLAVLFELDGVSREPLPERVFHVVLVMVTLALCWSLMNISFAVHYAHEYYRAAGSRGSPAKPPLHFPENPGKPITRTSSTSPSSSA